MSIKRNSFEDINLRDSIDSKSSLNLVETLKSSICTINSKKILISRYLLNKLLGFFQTLIENLDTNTENKKIMFKIIDLVKTEENNFTYENNFENEKFLELKNNLEKLKTENENLKKNHLLINSFNTELSDEVNLVL